MVICPPETKGLRSHCFSSGLITDVSVSDCSSPPLSSLEKVCRKPKPTRCCLSSEAFWVIGVVFGVIVVCGNEGASGFALGRDLGSRGAKASCISGPLWVMLANDLAPNEGGMFTCSSTQVRVLVSGLSNSRAYDQKRSRTAEFIVVLKLNICMTGCIIIGQL